MFVKSIILTLATLAISSHGTPITPGFRLIGPNRSQNLNPSALMFRGVFHDATFASTANMIDSSRSLIGEAGVDGK